MMNDSFRRTNEDVKNILTRQEEPAFEGTVKEGFERRFTVINERDVKKYAHQPHVDLLNEALELVSEDVELGRKIDGKMPFNNYIVINLDEPYVDEIIDIMKRHGHWG